MKIIQRFRDLNKKHITKQTNFRCPSCNKSISKKAAACPKCGEPITPEAIHKFETTAEKLQSGCLGFFLAILGFFLAIILIGVSAAPFENSNRAGKLYDELMERGAVKLDEPLARSIAKAIIYLGSNKEIKEVTLENPVTIHYDAGEVIFSKSGLRKTILFDAINFYRKLNEVESIEDVAHFRLYAYSPLVDLYGNQNNQKVAEITLSSYYINKIVWDNMLIENFERILHLNGDIWWHPAIRDN